MATAPAFLGEDGSASIATGILFTHHGLRRDLARFATALAGADVRGKAQALREEWTVYRNVLHGHHEAEDQRMFPHFKVARPDLVAVIDGLSEDHRKIDPLIVRGDAAFADLAAPGALADAQVVVREMAALLDAHLATEEASVVPLLRDAREFPTPANEDELQLFALGFAWGSDGVAPEVLAKMDAMLPPALVARLPAARAEAQARRQRVWGDVPTGASHTAVPDWLARG